MIYYIAQVGLTLLVTTLQIVRGLYYVGGYTDIAQQFIWIFQPITPALLYFIGIQAIGKALLIFMDMEDNTRRAARSK